MSKLKLRDTLFPTCPIRNILSRLGDKWTLLVLYTLQESGTTRFKELQRLIPDISQKMLTTTLRTLEQDGFVVRRVYAVVPPKVEYTLTERSYSLLPHINALLEWANEQMEDILTLRQENNSL